MDIIVVIERLLGLLFNFAFWFVLVFVGLMIIRRPKFLILIPVCLIVLIFKLISFFVVWGFEKILSLFVDFWMKNEIKFFEKSINNVGIKNDLDVGACHLYFNRIGANSINMLFYVYLSKAFEYLESEDCDDAQVERYIHLLEIMNRCLRYKPI